MYGLNGLREGDKHHIYDAPRGAWLAFYLLLIIDVMDLCQQSQIMLCY